MDPPPTSEKSHLINERNAKIYSLKLNRYFFYQFHIFIIIIILIIITIAVVNIVLLIIEDYDYY